MYESILPILKRKKLLYLVCIVLVFCLGVFAFHQWKQKGTVDNKEKRLQTTVDVAIVKKTNLVKRISLSGQTVPEAQVDIAAKYQGRVMTVEAALGQKVTAGQVLIVQDTGDAEISIRQNQAAYEQAAAEAVTTEATVNANYDKAMADYHKAMASFERNKRLGDIGGISKETLEESEQQLADAKAALDTITNQMTAGTAASIAASQAAAAKAQQSVNAAQKQHHDLILTAPRDGIIGYRQVEAGDIVSAGQKLLSIYDNSSIYVDCQISEQDLGAVNTGMNVNVQLESLGKTIPGKIIYISPANDATNLTFSLRIALLNIDPSVRSGMFARTLVEAPLRQNVLVVSKEAIVEKNGSAYVFVINGQNVVEQRKVEIGARGDESVEILSGLNEDEQIAVTNLARLRNGIIVVPHIATPDGGGDNP